MVCRNQIDGFNICRRKTSKWYILHCIWYSKELLNYTYMILGSTKRISNNDIVNYLMQSAPKQQLSTMGVENLFPYVGFTEDNLREYYENPPAGM